MYDRNPKFGQDQSFSEGARRVADFLWENTQGDVTSFPRSYLENLRYEFSDGQISMLEIIDRVDLGEDATYEDYCEVVDALMRVDPGAWPEPNKVMEVPTERLLYEFEPDLDFSEFNFAEEMEEAEAVAAPPAGGDSMSSKVELFLKKVISSVYMDGVSSVTDAEGNPPSEANNYLLAEDGKSFSGKFFDEVSPQETKEFPFEIMEKGDGQWSIAY